LCEIDELEILKVLEYRELKEKIYREEIMKPFVTIPKAEENLDS